MSEPLIAETFARAVASKNLHRLRDLVDVNLSFVGMTPSRVIMGDGVDDLIDTLGEWFDDNDAIEAIEFLDSDVWADRQRAGYRLRVKNPDGVYLVDQTAYLSLRDGRINWLRMMCAGYRPVED